MKKLLISGDTQIACYSVEENGTAQLLMEKPVERATYSLVQRDGVFTVFEGEDSSAFLSLNRQLDVVDRVEIPGSALCHLYDAPGTHTIYGSCYGTGHVVAIEAEHNHFSGIRSSIVMGEGEPGTPRAHCCILSPDGRFLLSAAIDQDRVYVWDVAADGSITPGKAMPFCAVPTGSGPRHLKFHPDGHTLYAVTEYSNEILVFDYEAENGILHWKETVSSLPYGFQGESYGSALLISRNGTRLYAANRGADTIALFAIEADRKLRPLAQYPCGGHWPRHMEFSKDETMLFVANERSGSVTLHCVDSETGELRIVGQIPFQRPGFAAEWDEF